MLLSVGVLLVLAALAAAQTTTAPATSTTEEQLATTTTTTSAAPSTTTTTTTTTSASPTTTTPASTTSATTSAVSGTTTATTTTTTTTSAASGATSGASGATSGASGATTTSGATALPVTVDDNAAGGDELADVFAGATRQVTASGPAVDPDVNNSSPLLAWVWLVIVVIVMAVAFAIVAFYILVYFQHEEDKNTAWLPKIILLVGMWLSMVVILMLPLDIANASTGDNLPMDILWQVVLFTAVVWTLLVIPFAQLYYEGEDPTDGSNSQLGQAIKVMIIGGVVFVILAVVGYLFLGVVQVPIHEIQCGLIPASVSRSSGNGIPSGVAYGSVDNSFEWRISIVLFLISMLTTFGTFLLACFGGIGITALPLDLINEFRFRPTRLTLEEYARAKVAIGDRAVKLYEIGKQIQEEQRMRKKRGRAARATFNRYKQNVYLLDEDWRKLHDAHKNRAGRIMWSYAQLCMGLFGSLLSVLWVLQIVLFMLPRTPGANVPTPVLDILGDFFKTLDNATALPIATAFYALFAFYLLACIMKGNFKFGLRIFVIFPIHPMRIGGTMLNSFLFNVGLILLSAISLVQFCTSAFIEYAQFSAAAEIFGIAVQNLRIIKYFYYFYSVGLVAIAVITLLYLLICPTARRIGADEK